jgi:hypothetical protein
MHPAFFFLQKAQSRWGRNVLTFSIPVFFFNLADIFICIFKIKMIFSQQMKNVSSIFFFIKVLLLWREPLEISI